MNARATPIAKIICRCVTVTIHTHVFLNQFREIHPISLPKGVERILAYVLISTESRYMTDVLHELSAIDSIQEAHKLYGAINLIAVIKSDSLKQLKETLTWKIRMIDKIRSSHTLITMDGA